MSPGFECSLHACGASKQKADLRSSVQAVGRVRRVLSDRVLHSSYLDEVSTD